MPIARLFAHLSCRDLAASEVWFTALFGRPPDARPMEGLAEWHEGAGAGLQLFEDAGHAGRGTMTLIVTGLDDERGRLMARGIEGPSIEGGDPVRLLRLRDPDGNLVVLAEPGSD